MVEGWASPTRIGIERHTATIAELWLRPRGGALEYLPRAYVLLEDRDHGSRHGRFIANDDPTSTGAALFLAGGSGLAPIRALLEAAAAKTRSSLTLISSARKSNAGCATRPHPLNLRAAPGSGTRVRYCPPRKGTVTRDRRFSSKAVTRD